MLIWPDEPETIFPQYIRALRFWWWCSFLDLRLKTLESKVKKSLFLNLLRSVTVGRRPGGHSTLLGKARSDCAFYLEYTNNNKTKKKSGNIVYVDLEASSSSVCSTIVQGLRLLHRIFKVNPNQLKDPDYDGSRSWNSNWTTSTSY